MKNIVETIHEELEARKDCSAWDKGVTLYALELLDNLDEACAYNGREPSDASELAAWLFRRTREPFS